MAPRGKLAQLLLSNSSSGKAGAAAARAIERQRQQEQEARKGASKKRKGVPEAAGGIGSSGERKASSAADAAANANAANANAAAPQPDLEASELELAAAEGAAYAALVRSMARQSDCAHAEALRRRQQEEGGWSGSSSSTEDDDEDEDEEEDGSSGSDQSGSESQQQESDDEGSGDESEEEEEEEEEDEHAAAANNNRRQARGGKAAADVDAADDDDNHPPAKHDYWEAHFGTDLSEGELLLQASGGKRTFVPLQADGGGAHGDRQGSEQEDDDDEDLWHGGRWEIAAPPAGAPGPWAGKGEQAGDAAAAAATAAPSSLTLPPAPPLLSDYGVRDRLASRWREVVLGDPPPPSSSSSKRPPPAQAAEAARKAAAAAKSAQQRRARLPQGEFASARQRRLFALLNTYADVLDCTKPYPALPFPASRHGQQQQQPLLPQRPNGSAADNNNTNDPEAAAALANATSTSAPLPTLARDDDLDAVLLHCLNHVLKSGDRVKRNNDRAREAERVGDVALVPRDQGFSRAKVLLLLPTRALAFRVVRRLVSLAQRETRADSVTGKEKFLEQFTDPDYRGDAEDDLSLLQARWEAEGAAAGSAGAAEAAARHYSSGGKGGGGAATKSKASRRPSTKPAEHRALFGPGLNADDHFRVGVKLTRGAVRLFSPLEESDVIVASPVALATRLAEARAEAAAAARRAREARKQQQRMRGAMGAGGGGASGGAAAAAAAPQPPGEADFLSSVEVCVVERADFMLMQNWAHVAAALAALNLLPAALPRGTDVMRVREWALSGHARRYRQTVATASFASPELLALFGGGGGGGGGAATASGAEGQRRADASLLSAPVLLGGGQQQQQEQPTPSRAAAATTSAAARGLCQSRAGAARLMPRPRGVLGLVVPQVRQLFERFRAASPAAAADARFEHFKAVVWPRIAGAAGGSASAARGAGAGSLGGAASGGGGLLLFVPSYFDFVRLRNFLREEEADFAALSEYCDRGEATRARARFFAGSQGAAASAGAAGATASTCRLLLYTERAHFYNRYRVRGVRDVLFYGLPEHAHYYSELLNLLEEGGGAGGAAGATPSSRSRHDPTSAALFCRWDAPALARVVGETRAKRILADKRTPTFMFC
jgi:U3 small nucleolar RNA-associated protein 25